MAHGCLPVIRWDLVASSVFCKVAVVGCVADVLTCRAVLRLRDYHAGVGGISQEHTVGAPLHLYHLIITL